MIQSVRLMTGVSGTAGIVKKNPNLVSGLGEQPPLITRKYAAPIIKRNPATHHAAMKSLNVQTVNPRNVRTTKNTSHKNAVRGKRQ